MKLCVFIILIYVSRCRGEDPTNFEDANPSCVVATSPTGTQILTADYNAIISNPDDASKQTELNNYVTCMTGDLSLSAGTDIDKNKLLGFYPSKIPQKTVIENCYDVEEAKLAAGITNVPAAQLEDIFKCYYKGINVKPTKEEIECDSSTEFDTVLQGKSTADADIKSVSECLFGKFTILGTGVTDLSLMAEEKLHLLAGDSEVKKIAVNTCKNDAKESEKSKKAKEIVKCYYEKINKDSTKAEIQCAARNPTNEKVFYKALKGQFDDDTNLQGYVDCMFLKFGAVSGTAFVPNQIKLKYPDNDLGQTCEGRSTQTNANQKALEIFKCLYTPPVTTTTTETPTTTGTPAPGTAPVAGAAPVAAPGAAAPGAAAPGAAALPACDDTPKKDKHVAHFKVYLQTPKPKKKSPKNKKNKTRVRPLKKEKDLDEEEENDDTK